MYLDSDNRPPITPQLAFRVAVIGGLALIMFAIIFFRLWYLQILSGDKYLADANNNRKYDGPPTDHAWIRSGESGDDGVSFKFKHAAEFMDLPFQFPFEAPEQ